MSDRGQVYLINVYLNWDKVMANDTFIFEQK